jgi:pyruvate,orthophosphate dikinase
MDEVYLFGEAAKLNMTKSDLGGKGYGLVEMTKLKLPVPPGIVITTKMCNKYFAEHGLWKSIEGKIYAKMKALEILTGKKFGDKSNPLLVSVRSGAPMSMPGMMDTILNLGINDQVVEAIALRSGERFAYDTYRRFLQLFGSIVLKIDKSKFDSAFEKIKKGAGAKSDSELDGSAMKAVAMKFKEIIKNETGREVEQKPEKQLLASVGAIFESWWNKRAIEYRKIYNIPDSMGTAVNIVSMVYGNYNDISGTGVAFTRNPSTGEKELYAEVLMNAQGEDVVSGIRTPMPANGLKKMLPNVYKELEHTALVLEQHFKDMQDFEFTIENGKFYMLQTRNGKRTPQAAVKIATDMLNEKLISEKEVLLRIEPEQLDELLHKQIDKSYSNTPIANGMPASPGAATGKVIFSIGKAVELKDKSESVILVRDETTPEDIKGIAVSDGILTSRGGMTSHAAVVTRGMGKPCIVGSGIEIRGNSFYSNGITVKEGDVITIDGTSGKVYNGSAPLIEPKMSNKILKVLSIADKYRKLGIRANADTPDMVKKAIANGAEGIGLARTERMFNSQDRLELVRKMILSNSSEERKKYLNMIKPLQKKDFKEMLEIANGKPVTIRLIDMPLHEFLPKLEELIKEIDKLKYEGKANSQVFKDKEKLINKVIELREANPMMGQRGVRLGIVYKEIYQMQVEAILEASIELMSKGKKVMPEIMISQVAIAEELARAKEIVNEAAENTFKALGRRVRFKFGTMVETPRAALTGSELAKYAEFFSFGTNDLTQATFAFSRDDIEAKFMPFYLSNKILVQDPFAQVDTSGVGRLIRICAEEGKRANKNLEIGVCGEHGGDPSSIEFFSTANIDYVSMSPSRVPVAKLAAARSAISGEKKSTA